MKNKDVQITENFRMDEFVVSDDYPQIAAEIELNRFEEAFITILVHTILQPARDYVSRVIKIISAKRNEELNGLVGGSDDSDHLRAMAADWVVLTRDHKAIDPLQIKSAFRYINLKLPYSFGQLILYVRKDGTPRFCHTSLPTLKHQGEVGIFWPDKKEWFK